MGLYRNIAGVSGQGIGMTIAEIMQSVAPTTTESAPTTAPPPPTGGGLVYSQPTVVQVLPPGSTWGSGLTLQDIAARNQAAIDAVTAAKQSYYNYLLTTSIADLTQSGYYVNTDTGDVYKYTDAAHTQSVVYLALQDIQDIENTAGTAGTLFMHMGLPVLAKDTAGYAGGGRASLGATTMYSTPIADVLALPIPATGPNVIMDYTPPVQTPPIISPVSTPPAGDGIPTTTTAAPPPATLVAGSTLGFVALGLAAIAVARSKKLLFVGGLGLLYYSLSKTKTA